jgi:ABC-type glycerol-3-phosphate transport system substrate-binding protein
MLTALLVAAGCAGSLSSPSVPASNAPPAASASSAANAQKVTIRIADLFTGSSAEAPAWKGALDAWEQAHPNVTLVREETPGDEHRNKMTVDLGANNVADVFSYWTGPASMNPFLDAHLLLDMDEYFALSKTQKRDRWNPPQLENSTFGGKLYALPIEAFKCFTLYNTKLFDQYGQKPPTTYAELKAVAKVFIDNGIVPVDMGSKGGNPGHIWYNDILYQLPNGLQDGQATTTSFDVGTASFRQAADIVADMVKNKIFPEDTIANGDWPPSVELYNQQKAAMVYTCPWKIADIKPEIGQVSEGMFFPTVDGAAIPGKDFNLGNTVHGLLINANSFHDQAKQAVIVDLVDWMMRDEVLNEFVKVGLFPAWKVDMSTIQLTPLTTKILDFTSKSKDTYSVVAGVLPTAPSLTDYLDAMDSLFAGGDPKEVIDKFADAVAKEKP